MDELVAMGFDEFDARSALKMFDNNVDSALEFLLSGNNFQETNDQSAGVVGMPLVLGVSQYTFNESGSSACTMIAAIVVKILLERLSTGLEIRDMDSLSTALFTGVERFNDIPSASRQHLAVDELDPKVLSGLISQAPIQGLVSNNNAFSELFQKVRSSGSTNKFTGIIITKTPETVCVVIPPTTGEHSSGTYALFDSHSRPSFGYDGAYLVTTNSEVELVGHLTRLFPAISFERDADLGQLQYNMFEAYAFQLE